MINVVEKVSENYIYLVTTLWDNSDNILAEIKTIEDTIRLGIGQLRRFQFKEKQEITGRLDWIQFRGNRAWIDYIVIREA